VASNLPLNALGVAPDLWKMVNIHEDMLTAQLPNAMQQAQQAQQAQQKFSNDQLHAIINGTATAEPNRPPPLADRARELFLKRMGGIRAEMKVKLGDFVACHIHAETVYVFFCFSGREGVVKENIDLFPSDLLVTQFRLLLS
jgi:hypothetical protein